MRLAPNPRYPNQYRLEVFNEHFEPKGFEFHRQAHRARQRRDQLRRQGYHVWVFSIGRDGTMRRLRDRELETLSSPSMTQGA